MTVNRACGISAEVSVVEVGRTCRYHRGRSARKGAKLRLCPAGFCPSLYHSVHPYAMSLMYVPGAGQFRDLACPAGNVRFSARSFRNYPAFLRFLFRVLVDVMRVIRRGDAELPEFGCAITVDKVSGFCPSGLKPGDSARYNLWDRSALCPASLHNIFPFLRRKNGGKSAARAIACPDPGGAGYRIEGGPKDICESRSAAAEFTPKSPGWPSKPPGFCPAAFYSIFPYLRVLSQGGKFGWLRPGVPVKVGCPAGDGIVMEAGIDPDAEGGRGLFVRIAGIRKSCPAGMEKDVSYRKF